MTETLKNVVSKHKDVVRAKSQLRAHNIIANSPLPKHKQQKHSMLVATCIMNLANAEARFSEAVDKLTASEKLQFLKEARG